MSALLYSIRTVYVVRFGRFFGELKIKLNLFKSKLFGDVCLININNYDDLTMISEMTTLLRNYVSYTINIYKEA